MAAGMLEVWEHAPRSMFRTNFSSPAVLVLSKVDVAEFLLIVFVYSYNNLYCFVVKVLCLLLLFKL